MAARIPWMSRLRCSLAHQSLIIAGSTAFGQVLFALLLALAARRSGPAAFGLAATALGAGGFLTGVLDFGFSPYSLRELAAGRMHRQDYWDRLRTKLMAGAAVAVALVVVGFAIERPQLGAMVGLVTVSRTLLFGVGVPLRAARRVGRFAAVVVAEKVLWLAGFAGLALGLSMSPLAAFGWSMAASTAVAAAAGLALGNGVKPFLGRARLASPWTSGAGYGMSSLAVSFSMLDVVLLGAAGGSVQAGLYGAVSRWTQPVLLLSQGYSAASAPVAAAARSSRAALGMIRGSLWLPALGLVACPVIIVLAPFAVPPLLGAAYRGAAPTLAILAVGAAAVVASQPLATFLQARGHPGLVGSATMSTVLVQLACVLLTAGPLGAKGAALAYAGSQLLLLLALLTGTALIMASRRRPAVPAQPPLASSAASVSAR